MFSFQVSNSFQTWKERYQRNMRNQELLEEHLQKKDSELLHYCLVKWVKFMLRCKAEKSYQKKLVQKVKLLSNDLKRSILTERIPSGKLRCKLLMSS